MPARKAPLDGPDPDEALRVARFHALIQEGLDDLDRGEGIEVTDVKAWLDTLGRAPPARGDWPSHTSTGDGGKRVCVPVSTGLTCAHCWSPRTPSWPAAATP